MSAEDYIETGYWPDDEQPEPRLVKIQSIDRETPKAWLLTIEGEQHWLPKSQCSVVQCVELPTWLADTKGF